MQIKLILSAAVIALVVGLAPASAADRQVRDAEGSAQFTTLHEAPAAAMTGVDMAEVRGMNWPDSAITPGPRSPHDVPATHITGPTSIHVVGPGAAESVRQN